MESSTTQQYVSRLVSSTQKDIPADEPQKTKLILRFTMNLREYQVQTQASNSQPKLKPYPSEGRESKNCTQYFQFVTYDENDLIADVGGYLGLLMGQSILALYDLGHENLKKLFSWYQKM